MHWLRISHDPILPERLLSHVAHRDGGGTVLFLGTVREHTGTEITTALEYEAYLPMAERQLVELATELADRWPILGLAIEHRLGRLIVGDISVGIAVNCPHRAEAFDACEFAIDRLKQIVPIWKQDHAADGTANWVHPEPTASEATPRDPRI
ncbi:molybdenum cofactor biosynthesis protein MoaE [Tuwongella immobilis]|uniref:Molybdopterin synthase catalytic subunit n=1 Tax=Tuwongella immobilis TaxID=692036 RepID=A0A6C2YNF2_9BACT|nr:molybdenum cofactor biosynthesis protein MoaE [Tuwongella immobilis]VIP03150.1 molybdenum cofactor biosynthesis protein : Molybdopterin converting factor (Subunit 2) OS=Planctomyces maris DSM 8797 GN=PM8797T_13453 PE=4 SV=1: MoaE [Tuwongella immobilis]VTS03537.1 molybdenum cofactor biosynthesis protein : Molybdopterin converting factor (Subunit 2) OS=Planctomyces maris DSM 8797 GN=PM8797T_13453 PE=4 SV=1: MoaE [Tuwongella immobilis]